MSNNFLEKIVDHKRKVLQSNTIIYNSFKDKLKLTDYSRYSLFKRMISQEGEINLIAEIKKASPSKGMLREHFDLLDIARVYVEHNAVALSILTEDKYFLGKPNYIRKVCDRYEIAILNKDFTIDERQIYEARYYGASAILLIVALLSDEQIKNFVDVATRLDLDCLVEVHDDEELKRALDCGAEIIGINNRDLKTFELDLRTCERLIPKVPKGKVIVAESGIHSNQDVRMLKDLGAHAVLIGETFMKAGDIGKKIDEVMLGA